MQSNRSIIYPALTKLCVICERASLLSHARRRLGRYLAIEILILSSVAAGTALLLVFPLLPLWSRMLLTAVYAFRIITMAFAHISILLLARGKSTPGDRVHSRIRYLGLTALNFVEIVIFGSLLLLSFQPLGIATNHFNAIFNTTYDVLYYNFVVATSFAPQHIFPLSPMAYTHNITITILSMEILAIVLAILLAIQPEDEAVVKGFMLPAQDYWEWRALSFEDSQWAKDNELRTRIAGLLKERAISSIADVGCGVGHLCRTLAFEGYAVIGIDKTQRMLDTAMSHSHPSVEYRLGDSCDLRLPDNRVDAVIMRMLLHNVLPDWRQALTEAKRVLRKGGVLLIVEGFPPEENSVSFFIDVLSLVHQRHFFTEDVLKEAIKTSGFALESVQEHIVTGVSVETWLSSAVPDSALRKRLMEAHLQMPEVCKEAYGAVTYNGDFLIDLHFKIFIATLEAS